MELNAKKTWVWLGLIMFIAVGLDFWRLGINGYGNVYYAATVKSMTQSLHNFFFASFDPGGFITVDKPPVGFWLQTLSAWIFGFKGWSILLPQALAGVVSVGLLYRLVAARFGRGAGLLSAFLLAITPISVATNRNNTIDSILTVALLLAVWALLRALDGGRLKWLLWAAVFLGIGFNIKYSEALLPLPAMIVAYLWIKDLSWRNKVLHLAAAACVLTAVSFSWAVAVDAVPPAARPWVGSTQTNSEVNLAIGYDGLNRVAGRFNPLAHRSGHFGGPLAPNPTEHGGGRVDASSAPPGFTRPSEFHPGSSHFPNRLGGFGRFGRGGGVISALRLFAASLGTQIGWWLPLAVIAAPLAFVAFRRRQGTESRLLPTLVLWTVWLFTDIVFFTMDPPLHTYYLVTMAPAVAAMVGIGWAALGQTARHWRWRLGIVALAGLATGGYQLWLAWSDSAVRMRLEVALGVVALGLLAALALTMTQKARTKAAPIVVGAALLTMSIVPAYWAGATLTHAENGSDPTAGPISAGTRGFGGFGSSQTAASYTPLIQYLQAHYQSGYLVATVNANTAAPIILQTGLPVMAMGGFRGTDPAITPAELAKLAQAGKIRYFLISGGNHRQFSLAPTGNAKGSSLSQDTFVPSNRTASSGIFFGGGGGNQQQLLTWIEQHSKPVPAAQWQGSGSSDTQGIGFGGFGFGGGGSQQLYEYDGPVNS